MVRRGLLVLGFVSCLLGVTSIRVTETDSTEEKSTEIENTENDADPRSGGNRNFMDWFRGRMLRLDLETERRHMAGFVLADTETLELAFKAWLVSVYFTSERILFKRTQLISMGGHSAWTSLPYGVIKAWSMRSSGTFLLHDTALRVWTSINSYDASILNMTFRNKTKDDESMIFDVNQQLTQKLLGRNISSDRFDQFGKKWSWANLWWFGRSMEYNHSLLEGELRNKVPLLGDGEEVSTSFQLGRDFEVFTEDRIIYINTQWWTGKVVEYRSLPWKNVPQSLD